MQNSKHVILISGKSPIDNSGGLGSYILTMARILAKSNIRTTIYCFGERNTITSYSELIKVVQIKTFARYFLGMGATWTSYLIARRIKKDFELKKSSVNTQITIHGGAIWAFVGIILKRFFRIPCRVSTSYFTTYPHEYSGHVLGAPIAMYGFRVNVKFRLIRTLANLFMKPIESYTLANCDSIVVHYESTKSYLLNDYPELSEAKILKIPYYVESNPAQYMQVHGTQVSFECHILCVSRQDPRKGLGYLFKALQQLKLEGFSFKCDVVGTGIFLSENKKLAEKLGLENDVTFHGYLPEPFRLRRPDSLYVFPSVEEGSGALSLIEAMSYGIPIISTNFDGITEDLTHFEDAILVNPVDVKNFVTEIRKLYSDKELQLKLSKNVLRTYQEKFKSSSDGKQFIEALKL